MGSQLQTSGGMKLATGLLLAGTIVVAYNIAGARAKPQTVRADHCIDCYDPKKIPEGGRHCGKDGDECDGGKACCSGLVCDGLTCGPAKKEECAAVREECHQTMSPDGESKACCNGLVCVREWIHAPLTYRDRCSEKPR